MSVLTDARQDVVDALMASGIDVDYSPFVPDDIDAPAVFVQFANPYVTPGGSFGEIQLNLVVGCFVGLVDNETDTTGLDDMLAAVLPNIADWDLDQVTVTIDDFNGLNYLGAAVEISNTINI